MRFGDILLHPRVTIRSGLPTIDSVVDGSLDLVLLFQGTSTSVERSKPVGCLLVEKASAFIDANCSYVAILPLSEDAAHQWMVA